MSIPTAADYRTMIESAPEAIIVYTPEKFLFVNRFAAERLGADPKSLIGHPIMEFVHPESLPAVVERIRQLTETGEGGPPLEVRFVSRNGEVMPAEIVSVPILFDRQKALLGLIRDIRKRAEMEQALREAQRRAGISETTIAVAHELNNVLTALVMNAELLAHDVPTDEIPEIASEILAASNRIAATVKRLRKMGEPKTVDYLGERKMLDLSAKPALKVRKKGVRKKGK